MLTHETFSNLASLNLSLFFLYFFFSSNALLLSSLPAFGTLAVHAFTLQANRSRIHINHAKTSSCNLPGFSDPFQGQGWDHTGVIQKLDSGTLQSFQRVGVKAQ
ncbi:hypothetical protein ILYODFUR_023009 [Ilyodon furcidens]|uniref:Uncharacterized protein n=1 Tax=Ilyodon furcidens TaxID=33524 RepID=A0ABV0SZC6_9TELE